MTETFYASAKLLISGEYAVLDGAVALAVPLKSGQWLEVEKPDVCGLYDAPGLVWTAMQDDELWFQGTFGMDNFELQYAEDETTGQRLAAILQAAKQLNPEFLSGYKSCQATTLLNFNRHWGWGSSSTLLACIAQWAGVDAYQLQALTMPGSGYDIACATASQPIIYQRKADSSPCIMPFRFSPAVSQHLYFVYLNQKQDTRQSITAYRQHTTPKDFTSKITSISRKMAQTDTPETFGHLMEEHESLISSVLQQPTIRQRLFSDYTAGAVKSLGAWGGDFALFFCPESREWLENYLKPKGYDTVFGFDEIVKQ